MATDAVRRARIAAGLTGTAMADKLGIKVPTYYKKESGKIKWTLEEAKAIADIFHTTIDALFLRFNSLKSGM